jgi:hypothetical protein
MALRDKPHILVPIAGTAQNFRPARGRGGPPPSNVPNRIAHAQAILETLVTLRPAAEQAGAYITLRGRPGEPIDAAKFDKSGLRLLNLTPAGDEPDSQGELVFFAPANALTRLEAKVEAFRDQNLPSGRPRNADLVQSIGALQRAQLRNLWRGPRDSFPAAVAQVVDWEVWVATDQVQAFVDAAAAANLHVAADRLHFPEQTVIRIGASRTDLAALIRTAPAMVTALAKPATAADFFDAMAVAEQPAWIADLLARTTFAAGANSVRVTLLDTGVTLGHPLLAPALSPADRFAADPAWGLDDVQGHGSGMAGLALYGDLTTALETAAPFDIPHRLESVKVIPDAGINPHHLLGAVTRRGIDAVEVGVDRDRVFVLASSTPDDHPHDGAPTSWSTELDQLAAGVSGLKRTRRLILTSAGNVPTHLHHTPAYHEVCDHPDQEIEAPAQAWNAITVGAFTDKSVLADPDVGQALAGTGDLSPHSKTASWAGVWPLKPDIVLEGGNLVMTALPPAYAHQDLCLLTTSNTPEAQQFTTFEATSAAAALGGRLAAQTWSLYPDRWPETIRALVVASARWTQPMLAHLPAVPNKGHYEPLFQRYGYGVPSLPRAGQSADDMVTLIVEDTITPYAPGANGGPAVHNHIKLHTLPWPTERLRDLGAQEVTLRVTLSTFVEPNPAEAARGRKLQYGSHGLRFKLKRADETPAQFERRINMAAQADEEGAGVPIAGGDQDGWRFGSRRRDVGSLHRDEITCPASDLARRPILAIHPVGGWWKTKLRQDEPPRQARYSLVVEIDAGGTNVDLYTEVQVALAAQIAAAAAVVV